MKVRKWLNDNSCNDLFSCSSTDSCSLPSLIVITDDEEEEEEEEEEEDRPDVVFINSSSSSSSGEDMMMTLHKIDRIVDRGESMVIEQKFNIAVENAAVQYACDQVSRVMNLDSENDDYIPSAATILHVLRWLSIEVITTCGSMQWRDRVKDKVREVLIERYGARMN